MSLMTGDHGTSNKRRKMGFQHFKENSFALERYFAIYEFSAKHLLCCSDCEALTLPQALDMADDECKELWNNLSLCYTESSGLPLLREEVASLYNHVPVEGVLIAAPQELILLGLSAILSEGDHCLVTWPGYQSLYETCISMGAEVGFLNVTKPEFQLLSEIKRLETKSTKALILNLPHNPTGYIPTRQEFDEVVKYAESKDWVLFCDEMYRWLEHDTTTRLPSACEIYSKAITLSGVSKSLSMPGVRVGWLATQDTKLLEQISRLKDYTTICTAGPSEILALIGLRNRDKIVSANAAIIKKNMELLKSFFDDHKDFLKWVDPKAGSIAFPALVHDQHLDAGDFCKKLVDEFGVMLLPGVVYEGENTSEQSLRNRFRLGFGRKNMEAALGELSKFLTKLR